MSVFITETNVLEIYVFFFCMSLCFIKKFATINVRTVNWLSTYLSMFMEDDIFSCDLVPFNFEISRVYLYVYMCVRVCVCFNCSRNWYQHTRISSFVHDPDATKRLSFTLLLLWLMFLYCKRAQKTALDDTNFVYSIFIIIQVDIKLTVCIYTIKRMAHV